MTDPKTDDPQGLRRHTGGETPIPLERPPKPTGIRKGQAEVKQRHRDAIAGAITIRDKAKRPLKRG